MGVLGILKVICDPEMSAPQVVPFSFGIIGALRATFYELFFFGLGIIGYESAVRGVWQYLRQLNISQ